MGQKESHPIVHPKPRPTPHKQIEFKTLTRTPDLEIPPIYLPVSPHMNIFLIFPILVVYLTSSPTTATSTLRSPDPPTLHPSCQPLDSYQASYVQDTYNRSNHMGHYYELAFRDLYPAPPNSDCHHTKKFQVDKEVYDETFSFDVIEFGTRMPCEVSACTD